MTPGRPVIVGVSEPTLALRSDAMEHVATSRTRAVIPVHPHGHTAHMPGINRIARRYVLAVIEDCAQAHQAGLNGEGRHTHHMRGHRARLGEANRYRHHAIRTAADPGRAPRLRPTCGSQAPACAFRPIRSSPTPRSSRSCGW
ncbi:DegT/DnrJ/EryC1/StrS family aminotransferase [Nocardiopsis baichengensis]|uniref:DegT/DnrJ/EryC1/StrS family aminotransferase n=1 Tax=Nocardiopsis baichengensis TaxID=280240 RepID=UPI000A05C78D